MQKIANVAAHLFIISIIILSTISILGVWDFFSNDVISKSFQSIGLLGFVAFIILVADHFLDQRTESPMVSGSAIFFKALRALTLRILILAVTFLALFGIMAIWEIFSGEIFRKSLASIAIMTFSSLVIVITCLERENNPILYRKKISSSFIILLIILAFLIPFFLRTVSSLVF